MIPKSAGRTPIACSNCAKTKTKCDKKFPCSRCAGRNLKCTLRPTRRASKQVNRPPVEGEAGSGNSSENGDAHNNSGSNGNSPQPQPELHSGQVTHHNSPEEHKNAAAPDGHQNFYDQSPPHVQSQVLSAVISPLPTPVDGFVQQTPMSGYEDFIRTSTRDGSGNSGSPPMMMDWSQMQMPQAYEAMAPPQLMMHPMAMDMNAMHHSPPENQMLPMMPDMGPGMPPVQTPMATPKLDGTFSDLEIGSSASMFFPTRHASISDTGIPDLGAIIASQDGWTVFRCTPSIPSSSCPKTARLNLEKLEQSLRNHEGWSNWRPTWDEADFAAGEKLTVMQLHESSRDKLLAITQSFLHKALDIHKEGMTGSPVGGRSPTSTNSNFVLLPPARVLEYFMRSYANNFERYYSLTSRGILDPNELLQCYNDKASSLLVLLMIAQGAMVIPSVEARWLTGGLTEACRISLFDLIEKNITMASDPIVLHAALLFTVQAAWSGDKWQMDIAMGQRGMYFAMLRHSGILEPRHTMTPPRMDGRATPEGLWSDWIQQESKSRYVESWRVCIT